MAEQYAQVGLRVVFNAAVAAGVGALYTRVRDKLLENEQVVKLYEQFKEWGDLIIGAATVALYEMFRGRLPANRLLDQAVAGFAIFSMAKSFEVALGAPFVLVQTDGKAYIKNIPQLPEGGWQAYIDSVSAKVAADGTIQPATNISAGPHDFAVLGAGKAASVHQYLPALSAGTA